MNNPTLLIIEDESAIRDMICFAFTNTEFTIITAEDAELAKTKLTENTVDLILLDWMLPKTTGIDFIKWLRNKTTLKNIPIIMLTAKAEEESKVMGLNVGADDYITKPFSPKELVARAQSILRRGPLLKIDNLLNYKNIEINLAKKIVYINHEPITLTSNEYKLLIFFMSNKNKVFDRDQIINAVWGVNSFINDRTVDAQIKRLRKKLKPFGYENLIQTIRGHGYLFS